jgi:hypothetical protein
MGISSKPEPVRHLINQFLDEEETLYNNMSYVSDVILEMKDGDHVVFTFNNESRFKEIVNAAVRRGIDRNQINVLHIYRKESQKIAEALLKLENAHLLFNRQDIRIIPADEGFSDGNISAVPSLNSIRNTVELAKHKSKNGLNVLATSPSKLIQQGRYEDALKPENDYVFTKQSQRILKIIF